MERINYSKMSDKLPTAGMIRECFQFYEQNWKHSKFTLLTGAAHLLGLFAKALNESCGVGPLPTPHLSVVKF